MRQNDYKKKLISLAVPIALQNLMLALVAACDAMMLGNLEQDSMAAVSLATQIQFVQNMIISSIVAALSILGAQYWGKGDIKSMSSVFGNALRLSVIISLAFFVGCVFFPHELMYLFTNEEIQRIFTNVHGLLLVRVYFGVLGLHPTQHLWDILAKTRPQRIQLQQ